MAVSFRSCAPAFLLWVSVACSAPSPIPEEVAADLPPERELDAETAARLERLTVEALRLLNEERFDEAEQSARAALSLQPREARPRAVLGTCLMHRAGQVEPPDLRLWRQAEGELLAASRTAPSDPVAGVLYGQFLVEDEHLTAAAEVAEAVLEHEPDDVPTLRLAAETRYELGEERLAIPHLERWSQLDPDPQIRYKLAWCLLRVADSDLQNRVPLLVEAAESFAAYRELEPDDLQGYLAQGRALFRVAEETADEEQMRARADEAIALYTEAAARFAQAAEPAFGLGVSLELVGRTDAAIQAYEQALERDSRQADALLNLAFLLDATGQRERAEAMCRRALLGELTSDERRRVQAFLDAG